MPQIHPSALVDPAAELDASVRVGPYTVIGPHVRVEAGTTVGPHCVIEGRTTIGQNNTIFQFCSLGAVPQDKKYAGEPTELVIGDGNTIREFCSINLGTAQDAGVTRVGNHNWIMAYVHFAHDCRVGDHCTIASYSALAGHVRLDDWVTIGGQSGVLQRMRVGAHAMVGFLAHVNKDVPPFMIADGNPLAVRGVNLVGLRRRDFSATRLAAVREMHKLLYRQGHTVDEALTRIAPLADQYPDAAGDVAALADFVRTSASGIAR